ncbi:MAG: M23 family metallopeptidase [Aquificae bacterium]|nr:M23 family metallopeptidase [Aquificota bacterium]
MRKLIALAFLGLLLYGAYELFLFKPSVEGHESLAALPRKKEVTLRVRNPDRAQKLRVVLLQDGKEFVLFEGKPAEEVKVKVEPKKLGLKEGKAEAVIELTRLFVLKDRVSVESVVDYTPPRVTLLFYPYAVINGGSGAVKVSVSEPSRLELRVVDRVFPFYALNERVFFSLFAVPLELDELSVKVVAVDGVGNASVLSVPVKLKKRRYPVYYIDLKKRKQKLLVKLSTLLGEEVTEENFLEAFKKVNEEMRRENEAFLSELGRRSEPRLYWKGRFLQMRNSKVISVFGEKRVYTYGGKYVSESYHWGYDLASVKNAPVEAANDGKVVFTGFLGIYGNTVVLDHGYGLTSVYAHLSDFKVKKGDEVKKGQIIGFTDETGLAFGDHLHFGVMVHGYPVNPIEWWDGRWIKNAILPALQAKEER